MTPREFLAMELRLRREAAKMTQKQEAEALYISDTLIQHWEAGRRIPSPDHAERFDTLHGTGGIVGRIIGQLVTSVGAPEWMEPWLELERRARRLCSVQPNVPDGLLQTEDYARAVLADHRFHLTIDIEEAVSARLDRQRILERDDPPILVAVMAETVLKQTVGDAQVMYDQLLHLGKMSERENVAIHVLPFASPAAGFTSPFILASVGPEVAYVDNQLSAEVVREPAKVATLSRQYEAFRKAALGPHESRKMIMKVAEQWQTNA
jgi:transcriptional regulator with XRE-family HTH domain